MTALRPDPWLAEILGKAAWVLDNAGHPDLESALEAVDREGPSLAWTRLPAEQGRDVRRLENLGFRLVDVSVTMEKPCGPVPQHAAVRNATAADAAAVEDIARRAFVWDRFHQDPATAPLADELTARWAGNFFAGRRGDALAVAERNGRVAGFALALLRPGAVVVDLIAVDPDTGRGLGATLLGHLEALGPGRVLRAGTQLANSAALAFYQKNGMRVAGGGMVLHRHGGHGA